MAQTLRNISKDVAEAAAHIQHYFNLKSQELRKQRLYRIQDYKEGELDVPIYHDIYGLYELGEAYVRLTHESMEMPTHMKVDEVSIELDTDVLENAEEVTTNMHLGREEYSELKFRVTFRSCAASEGHLALAQQAAETTKRDISTAAPKPIEKVKHTKEQMRAMIKQSEATDNE